MGAESGEIKESKIHENHQVQAKCQNNENFRHLRLSDYAAEEKDKLYPVLHQKQKCGPENVLCGNIFMKEHQKEGNRRQYTVAGNEIIVHPTHILQNQTEDTA